jgi:hypothetical protein
MRSAMRFMAETVSCTACPPASTSRAARSATCSVWPLSSAFRRMVACISSMLAVVSSTELA